MSGKVVGALGVARSKKEGFVPEDMWELDKTYPGNKGDVPTERFQFKPNSHSLTFSFLTLSLVFYRWKLNWSVSISRTRSWS